MLFLIWWVLDRPNEIGSGLVRKNPIPLSRLIDIVNSRFGTNFNQADQDFFDQLVETVARDESIIKAAEVNPEDKFELVFREGYI